MVALVLDDSRPACLPLPFICLPLLFVSHLSPTSFHLSPRLGACGRVPGWLVSHFFSFVSQAGCLWSGSRLACLPLPFICLPLLFISHLSPTSFHCLPGWVLAVGFPAGLSPTSFHLSPISFYLSPRLGAWVSSRLVSHFLAFVSHFFPQLFTVIGVLNSFLRCVRPLCQVSAHFHWPCSISSVRPFPLAMQHFYSCVSQVCHTGGVRPFLQVVQHFYSFVSQVCHCWCPPFFTGNATSIFICLPGLSLVVSALFRYPCSISIHFSSSSVAAGVQHFY